MWRVLTERKALFILYSTVYRFELETLCSNMSSKRGYLNMPL